MFPNLLAGALLLAIVCLLFLPALRLRRIVALAIAFAIVLPLGAFAQTATTVTTAPAEPIHLGPFVTIWAPFVNAIAQNVIGVVLATAFAGLLPLLPSFVQAFFTASARATLTKAAQTAAGNVLAKVEGNLSTMSFNVGNPLVHQMVDWVISTGAPAAVTKFGLSPDDVAEKIVAEIGKLQAKATPATPTT